MVGSNTIKLSQTAQLGNVKKLFVLELPKIFL